MKKILIVLSIIGLSYSGTEAQTKVTDIATVKPKAKADTAKANFDKNYKVCKDPKSKYYVCGDKPSTKAATKTTTKVVKETNTTQTAGSENAKNFKVCKGDGDYHICDQHPNAKNSVPGPGSTKISGNTNRGKNKTVTVVTRNGVRATSPTAQHAEQPLVAPQSQSLKGPANNSIITYDTTKNDTVTNATAPYNAKPSPQYDGPEKNKGRNMIQSTPINPTVLPK